MKIYLFEYKNFFFTTKSNLIECVLQSSITHSIFKCVLSDTMCSSENYTFFEQSNTEAVEDSCSEIPDDEERNVYKEYLFGML